MKANGPARNRLADQGSIILKCTTVIDELKPAANGETRPT